MEIRIKEATGNPKPSKPLQNSPGFMKEAAKKPAVCMQLFDFNWLKPGYVYIYISESGYLILFENHDYEQLRTTLIPDGGFGPPAT